MKKVFAIKNQWIDVKFEAIGDDNGTGCSVVSQSKVDKTMFGVRLKQTWKSSRYSDEGYLFLLWEFPDDGGDPVIHVRTWQPSMANGTPIDPDPDILTLGAYNK